MSTAAGAVVPGRLAFAEDPVSPSAVAELPSKITLEDALQIFRARGFDLLIADAAVESAEGDAKIARALPNPIGNLGYGRVFNYTPPPDDTGSANQWTIGLSDNTLIEETIAGKRTLKQNVAKNALAAAKMVRQDAQRALELQIKAAYVQVVLAIDALEFATQVRESSTQTLDLNKRRYAAGAINEGDLARVETAKLEADQGVDQAAAGVRQARVGLAFLLGVRGRVPEFDVDRDTLKYRVPGALASQTPDQLLRAAFDTRPDLRALGYQKDRAESAIALAKRQRIPDIALNVQYTQTGSGQSAIQPPTLSFGVSGPLPIFYQQQGEVKKAEADYASQSAQRAKLTAQVVSEVESGYAAFASSRLLVERMESSLLERAKTARDITKRQFEGGTATLIDYLDAQRTFIATNLEYLHDLTDYWTAVYQLEAAVGTELRR